MPDALGVGAGIILDWWLRNTDFFTESKISCENLAPEARSIRIKKQFHNAFITK